jgi:D-3-phosphoglycerate dehydrogenase
MDVLGNDVRPLPEDLRADIDIESVGQDELFERSDIVSLNCALTPETRGLVGPAELAALDEGGYLVNTCRGEVVQQDALVNALREGTIAGAALDVFEKEPLSADDPLTEFNEVVLGSHNAQNTEEAVARTNDRAVENLIEGLGE